MVKYREIIRLRSQGCSVSEIAGSIRSSRNTVSEVLGRLEEVSLEWPISDGLTDEEICKVLFPERTGMLKREPPNYEKVHKELSKRGITLTLLWSEYCEQCILDGTVPYQYTMFCDHYHAYALSNKATLRIHRKPGEVMEVDWVGDPMYVYDQALGTEVKASIFVACLPCSLYVYAEASPDVAIGSWIEAHNHAYQYFGGSTRLLVPDNLKTGVIKNTHTETVLNRTYADMAAHYDTAIVPARVRKPKDKATVGNAVRIV